MVLLIIAGCLFINSKSFINNAGKTTGVIDNIYYFDSKGIDISYYVDDTEYEKHLSVYSSTMDIGDEITVYYNQSNPAEIKITISAYLPAIILGSIGIVFFLIGFIFIIVLLRKTVLKKRLLRDTEPVLCPVKSIDINKMYCVNGRHPYIVYVEYKDPFTSQVHILKSHSFSNDPSLYISQDTMLPVYVDRNNAKKYYIDIKSVAPELN